MATGDGSSDVCSSDLGSWAQRERPGVEGKTIFARMIPNVGRELVERRRGEAKKKEREKEGKSV